jgi:hypothetical protein
MRADRPDHQIERLRGERTSRGNWIVWVFDVL